MVLDDARRFIAAHDWTFARTMPWCPHEYVVRQQVDEAGFVTLARAIRAVGYRAYYGKTARMYLDIDGWQYWTMGNPLAETTIINRARLGSAGAVARPDPPEPPLPDPDLP